MVKQGIEKIFAEDGKILAMVGRTFQIEGKSSFISPPDFGFQLCVQNAGKGECWRAHEHKHFDSLNYLDAQEFIYIINGQIIVGIYEGKMKVADSVLNAGDFAILNSGHDIRSLENNTKYIVIKQGPYRGPNEKIFIN